MLVMYALQQGHGVVALARKPTKLELPEEILEAAAERLRVVKGHPYWHILLQADSHCISTGI